MIDRLVFLGLALAAALLPYTACAPEDDDDATDRVTIERVVVNQGVALEFGSPSTTPPDEPFLVQDRPTRWSLDLRRTNAASDGNMDLEIVLEGLAEGAALHERVRMPAGTTMARFHVWLDGALLPEAGSLQLRIRAPSATAPPTGPRARRSFAIPDDLQIGAVPPLTLELVPVHHVYYDDCEPWDPAQVDLEAWRENVLQRLPLPDIRWEVAEPLPWPHPVRTFNDQLAIANLLAARAEADPSPARIRLGVARRCAVCDDATCVDGIADTGSLLTNTASAYLEVYEPDAYPTATVHEIGHTAGLDHAPCPDDIPRADPDFPVADGRIDAVGLGIFDGLERDPASTYDVMSYCAPGWVSRYHWLRLLDAFAGPAGHRQQGTPRWHACRMGARPGAAAVR